MRTVRILAPLIGCVLAAGPVFGTESQVISYAGEPGRAIAKVADSIIFVWLPEAGELVTLHPSEGEIDRFNIASVLSLPPNGFSMHDFSVSPLGNIACYVEGVLGVVILVIDSEGREVGRHRVEQPVRDAKLAHSESGRLFLHGLALEGDDRSGIVILRQVGLRGEKARFTNEVELPDRPRGGRSRKARSYWGKAVYALDSSGHHYMHKALPFLTIVAPSGSVRQVPLPESTAEVQILRSIVTDGARRPWLVQIEGENEAPEDEFRAGFFVMHNPEARIFEFDPETDSFQEIYRDVPPGDLVGRLPDGRAVFMGQQPGQIDFTFLPL